MHATQTSIDDMAEQAKSVTEEAINRSERGANEFWKSSYLGCIHALALRRETFTADDVMLLMEKAWPGVWTRDNRAAGALMKTAMKNGWIESTEQFILSVRPGLHRCPRRVWRSLLHRA